MKIHLLLLSAFLLITSSLFSSEEKVSELISIIDNTGSSKEDRQNALLSLGQQEPKFSKKSLVSLQTLLGTTDTDLLAYVIQTTGSLGSFAKPAVPKLIELTASKSVSTRREAVSALGLIGDTSALSTLESLSKIDKDKRVRRKCLASISQINSNQE